MEEKHKLPVSAKIIVKQVDGEPYIYLKPIYDDEKETPPTVDRQRDSETTSQVHTQRTDGTGDSAWGQLAGDALL